MDFTPSRRTYATNATTRATRPRYEKLSPIKRRRLLRSPLKIIFVITIVLAVTVALSYTLTHLQKPAAYNAPAANTEQPDNGKVAQENPNFAALTPAGRDVSWTHLTPPNSDDFYAFTDKLEGVSIRVSEQPLPNSFIDNPSESLAQLARNYNANRDISVNGITVYIGTSTKGQQSLLFTTDALLFFITSDTTLNDKQWTSYITSLN